MYAHPSFGMTTTETLWSCFLVTHVLYVVTNPREKTKLTPHGEVPFPNLPGEIVGSNIFYWCPTGFFQQKRQSCTARFDLKITIYF